MFRLTLAAILLLAFAPPLLVRSASHLVPSSRVQGLRWRSLKAFSGVPRITYKEAAIAATNRTVLSSCSWSPVLGTCRPTHNILLQESMDMTYASFGARALAFRVALTAYCSQFPRKAANCSHPCFDNGEVCAPVGALLFGMHACPGSQAATDAYCMQADSCRCKENPACVYKSGSNSTPASCVAKFKKNLTDAQLSQYIVDWATTQRNVWGCCEGSQAKWMTDFHCDRLANDPDTCNSMPGCAFNEVTGECSWLTSYWLASNFPLTRATLMLVETAQQCTSFSVEEECTGYRPIRPNPALLRSILRFDLATINTPVANDTCVVWDSGDEY